MSHSACRAATRDLSADMSGSALLGPLVQKVPDGGYLNGLVQSAGAFGGYMGAAEFARELAPAIHVRKRTFRKNDDLH